MKKMVLVFVFGLLTGIYIARQHVVQAQTATTLRVTTINDPGSGWPHKGPDKATVLGDVVGFSCAATGRNGAPIER
jgi:hypothetical protein